MILVVMGVTGCGKTTLAKALAARLAIPFHDADDHHPPANRAKLGRNEPLDDDDRAPWLALLAGQMAGWEAQGGAVLACSALKERYRDVLRGGNPEVVFVFLEGDAATIARRLEARARRGHLLVRDFDRILEGQFRDLEPPADAIRVPIAAATDEAVQLVAEELGRRTRAGASHKATR